MATTTPQGRLFDILTERIRQDRYPSHQLLDKIEAILYTPQQITAYVDLLNDKIDEAWYPSHQLIDRAERMLGLLARLGTYVETERRLERNSHPAEADSDGS